MTYTVLLLLLLLLLLMLVLITCNIYALYYLYYRHLPITLLHCSASSAGLSLPISPTSLLPSPPTAADLSSPEHRDDATVPAASRDCDHEADVTSASLELTSEFKKVYENINRLSKYGDEATFERSFGDETDVSLAANDDAKDLSETDVILQTNDVKCSSDSDVIGGRDSISIEKDKNVCDSDSPDVSNQPTDDIEDAVVELKSEQPTQSPSLSSQLLVADVGANDGTATVKLAGDSVRLNIDELFRLSSGDVAEKSRRSDDGNVSDSSERVDIETDVQHESGGNCPPSVAQETCISDSPAQVAETQGSYDLMSDSRTDMESYSVSTASNSYNYEFSFGQNDCSRVSNVETVEPSQELNDIHDGNELTLSENQLENIYNGWRKTSTADDESKSEVFVDTLHDRQSSFNEDILENPTAVNCYKSYSTTFTDEPDASNDTCLTSSAPGCLTAEVERLSLNAAADAWSCASSKDSHPSSTSDKDVAEFVDVEDGEEYCDSKMDDWEIVDGVPSESVGDDATRSEEINSCSSSRVHSLGTADMTNDEDSSRQKCLTLDVASLHHLEPTDVEQAPSLSPSAAAASSSRLLSPTLSDDTAAVPLNACDLDQTTTATREFTCASPNEPTADITPRSLSSSSSSLDSQVNILSLNGSGLEEQERTAALMREDTALNEAGAEAAATSLSSSSSPSSSCLVHSYTIESQKSAAASGEDRCVFDYTNEAATEKRHEKFCDLSDPPLSHADPTAFQDHASQDASAVQDTADIVEQSEHHLAYPISDLQQVSDRKTARPLLVAVSVAKQPGSEAPTATSVAGFEKDEEFTANRTGQARNALPTENTSSEDDEPEVKVEQTQERPKYVDVSRKRLVTEHVRRETMQTEATARAKDLSSPALPVSHPSSQLVTHFSGDGRDRDGDYCSRLEGDATETDSRDADSDRTSFTTVSTLHVQPPATKDRLLVCTLNSSRARNTRTRPISPTVDREDRRTTAVNEKSTKNTSSSLPVTSVRPKSSMVTAVNGFASKKSDSYDTGDRASTIVEGRSVTASSGRRDDMYVDVHSVASSTRVKALPVTEVYKDGKSVTRKSENSDVSRHTSARSDMASRRPPAAVVSRISTAGQTSARFDSDSSFLSGNVAKSPTTVSAAEKWERGSEVEKGTFKSSSGGSSFTEVRNETNYFDKSKRSSERNSNRVHAVTATTDNVDYRYSPLQDRIRADEKEQAVRQLQSFLGPLCQNANSLPRVPKAPVVSRNPANAQVMADLRDAPITSKSRPSDDVICDVRLLSTNETARRQKPCLQPLIIHQPTASLSPPAGCHDANNNKQPSAARDVIKMSPMTRRSRGDQLSPWQQDQVLYDVTITLSPTHGSFRQPAAAGYDQNNQRFFARQLSSEHNVSRGVVPSHRFTAGVFRRSLSLPVVDRSEAFMMSSTAVWERDRVRLPQTVHRTSPPTRLIPSSAAPSVLRDYQFDYRR